MERLQEQFVAAGKRPMFLHFGGTMLNTQTMQTVFQYQMGGCTGDIVPLAVGRWYDFPECGGYLGNVGQTSD